MQTHSFTSESVSEGHPDKLADRISDTVLDALLKRDPHARVACETLVARDLVVVAGEFQSREPGLVEELRERAPEVVRGVLRDVGYRGDFPGIDPDGCRIEVAWNRQSPDIDRGVSLGDRGVSGDDRVLGAGDQGMVFGYATDETPELMPLPILLAHRLVARQAALRRSGELGWLRPDAKAQVTVRYTGGRPEGVETVVLSTQHDAGIPDRKVHEAVAWHIVRPVIPEAMVDPDLRILVNPAGPFVSGGPEADTGLTGRKIIVDTYGGACPHGGGAFSGKDATKVDRSGAYAARQLAKTLVARGTARRCTVQLAYAIGEPVPVSVHLDFHGTGREPEAQVVARIRDRWDLTPRGIIQRLRLLRPIYAPTSAYGHFGREGEGFPWEEVVEGETPGGSRPGPPAPGRGGTVPPAIGRPRSRA